MWILLTIEPIEPIQSVCRDSYYIYVYVGHVTISVSQMGVCLPLGVL